jgi:membrane associated rhomboid family serine protease
VLTLIPVFFYPLFLELPALVFLGVWFLSQLFSGTLALAGPRDVGGVAWFAHVGGFLYGLLLCRLFVRAEPEPPAPPPRHFVLAAPPESGHWR